MLRFAITLGGIGVVLLACGADGTSSQSTIGQDFEELASSIKDCAETHGRCGGGKDSQNAVRCREQFLSCRSSAGKPAEADLAAAVGDCQDSRKECKEDDSGALACDQELHECVGELRPPTNVTQERPRVGPDAHAPTYQCFGMLRECAASASAPSQCAAQARTCVIAAVGEPPRY
jgi:hypothetical protein